MAFSAKISFPQKKIEKWLADTLLLLYFLMHHITLDYSWYHSN